MNLAVLGSGSWGTALALLAHERGHAVRLWARNPTLAEDIAVRRENARYLPGRPIPQAVLVNANLATAVEDADAIVIALPSAVVRQTAERVGAAFRGLAICASKGIEAGTHATLDRVLQETWPAASVALLSGPTFAIEIARGLPAAAVAAARDETLAVAVHDALSCPRFRVYTSDDVMGVAVGGALKNVIAIAAGCSDGFGFGANARAALVTRGLAEMGRLAAALGGQPLTLAGLAGLGDLVLTCTGELSRNRTVGLALARGEPLPSILARLGQVAEGIDTAGTAAAWARSLGVVMPITERVAAVLAGQLSAHEAVAGLLARDGLAERASGAG